MNTERRWKEGRWINEKGGGGWEIWKEEPWKRREGQTGEYRWGKERQINHYKKKSEGYYQIEKSKHWIKEWRTKRRENSWRKEDMRNKESMKEEWRTKMKKEDSNIAKPGSTWAWAWAWAWVFNMGSGSFDWITYWLKCRNSHSVESVITN